MSTMWVIMPEQGHHLPILVGPYDAPGQRDVRRLSSPSGLIDERQRRAHEVVAASRRGDG